MIKRNDKKFTEKVRKRVGEALYNYQLLQEGDKILVGLSGGKDSMGLLDTLVNRRKIIPFDFDITAIHIDLSNIPYETDREYLQEFCNQREVEFIYEENDIEIETKKEGQAPCFYCSWTRRKTLFTYAVENGFNKVALGHHLDDAVETLLMNMSNHGEYSSLPAKLSMFDGKLELIRPLLLLTDRELMRYSEVIGYKPLVRSCPYENVTQRTDVREIIHQFSKINPKAKFNIFRAMENINKEYLPKSKENKE